ncbi:MAG: hypothetical protein K2H52_00410 [Lachnospiraceae bacterium]|nr:hypothetical protein [Lachnospiraceae bacterium]
MGTKDQNEMMEDFRSKMEATNKIYEDLLRQRDKVKSATLFKLLNEELAAYVNLSVTFAEYLQLHLAVIKDDRERTSNYLHESLKAVDEIEDKKMASVLFENVKSTYEALCALDDLGDSALNLSIGSFMQAVSRDFKDWEKIIKMLLSNLADLPASMLPVISEIKGLYDNVKNVAELMNAFEENGTDYLDVDEKLLKIDFHIKLMQMVDENFKHTVESLKNPAGGESE